MKRTLVALAVIFLIYGNASAQDQPGSAPNNESKSRFSREVVPGMVFMQPVMGSNFSLLTHGLNLSLVKFKGDTDASAARFMTVGIALGVRKDNGTNRTDGLFVFYPVSVPVARVDNSWELHYSAGVVKNFTHGEWGFTTGFSLLLARR